MASPQRSSHWRYLFPGLFTFALLTLFPLLFTIYVSMTNWKTGHVLTKDQVIERLLEEEVLLSEEIYPTALSKEGLTLFRKGEWAELIHRYKKNSDGSLTDVTTNQTFYSDDETKTFRSGDISLAPGFRQFVGLENYKFLLSDPSILKSFAKIIPWTFAWAFFSVLLCFVGGFFLALLLNQKNFKGKIFYRTLFIIPYAIPCFISILLFKGLLNKDFGQINQLLGISINWFGDGLMAKVSCLMVNFWLGMPYMLLVITGLLQSIPNSLYEASRIEGANFWQRFSKITFPLVFTGVAPLLVGSFAFNLNNFVGIYLLTSGGPPLPEASDNAGHTDILISYAYKLAFEGGMGQDFGLASSMAVLIFILILIISLINFRLTGVLGSKK